MKSTRWQFSLRALLIFLTIASFAIAIFANYPALVLAGGVAVIWFLLESGILFDVILAPFGPLIERIPYRATTMAVFAGITSIAFGAFFIFVALYNLGAFRVWIGSSFFATLF